MKLSDFWSSLTEKQQAEFAENVNASVMTIKQKYMCPTRSREIPRKKRWDKMASCLEGKVSRTEMFDHFYPPQNQELAS